MPRPSWFDEELYPFASHFVDVAGATVHYLDEGDGPVLLMLHGNPTWSFLYRHLVAELADRFRCIALDYPGFGLSTAPAGYRHSIAEHASVVEGFMEALDLHDVTVMVQDWGGPIGFATAIRHPERFRGFVVGNTFGWVATGDKTMRRFSRIMGGAFGGFLVKRLNFFVRVGIPAGIKRKKLTKAEKAMYRGPFPTAASRVPLHVMPAEILEAEELLTEVERGLHTVADKPALIVWGDKDVAFKEPARRRWEATFPNHHTVILPGAGHYIQEDSPAEIAAAVAEWAPGGA